MNQAEKLELLREWADHIQQSDRRIDPISEALGLSVESPIHLAVWELQSAYTKAVAKLVGDQAGWLYWHANENDFGAKAMKSGPSRDMRPIKTLDDLLWVIEVAA